MILDFTENSELVVAPITDRGDARELTMGTELKVEILLPDGIRAFTSKLRRISAVGAWHLAWPAEAKRIQRRDFVRVEVELNADIRIFGKVEGVAPDLKGTTSDISAGGMRLQLPVELPAETIIGIQLHVPGVGVLDALGKVLRSAPLEQTPGQKYLFWAGVEYTDVSESVRKLLVNLVFEIQRDLLRRV